MGKKINGKRRRLPFEVKPVSRKTDSLGRLRALKCFQEAHDRICEGWSLNDVAAYIQEVRKEATDLTRGTLVVQLSAYRKSIPPAQLAKRITPVFKRAAERVAEGMDELEEMEKLYRLQMERLEIDFHTEKNIRKLLPTMTQEVRTAREILKSYADLKMDLGLSKRHLGQLDVDAQVVADTATRYGRASVGNVLSDPESKRKVLGLAHKLLDSLPASSGEEDDHNEGRPGSERSDEGGDREAS